MDQRRVSCLRCLDLSGVKTTHRQNYIEVPVLQFPVSPGRQTSSPLGSLASTIYVQYRLYTPKPPQGDAKSIGQELEYSHSMPLFFCF